MRKLSKRISAVMGAAFLAAAGGAAAGIAGAGADAAVTPSHVPHGPFQCRSRRQLP